MIAQEEKKKRMSDTKKGKSKPSRNEWDKRSNGKQITKF